MALQYLVLGANQFGCSVALALESQGCEVTIVDTNLERIQDIADDVTSSYCCDATDEESLISIGIKNVDGVVVSICTDMAASIVACMLCEKFGVKNIIARAKSDMHQQILEKIGVHRVVNPEKEMGARIGNYLTGHSFTDWINLSPDFSMVEVPVFSDWVGNTIIGLDLRKRYHLNIVCIRQGNDMKTSLDPGETLKKDMTLFIVGKNEDLQKVNR